MVGIIVVFICLDLSYCLYLLICSDNLDCNDGFYQIICCSLCTVVFICLDLSYCLCLLKDDFAARFRPRTLFNFFPKIFLKKPVPKNIFRPTHPKFLLCFENRLLHGIDKRPTEICEKYFKTPEALTEYMFCCPAYRSTCPPISMCISKHSNSYVVFFFSVRFKPVNYTARWC
jgi:hypothetical protein